MKKVLAIVLSVAMLACFATSAFAAAPITFTLTSDKEYVKAGEKFTVTVGMPEGAMSTGNLYVEYDTEALTVSPIRDIAAVGVGAKASGAANVMNDSDVVGVKYAMAFMYPSSSYGVEDTNLFTVTFTVADDAADGTEYEVKFRASDITVAKSETDPETEDVEDVTLPESIKVIVGEAPAPSSSEATPAPSSSEATPAPSSEAASVTSTASTTTSTSNPKTGDAGVAVFAAIVAAAAAAAFVAGKKNA